MPASASHRSDLVPAKRAQGPTSITTRHPEFPTQFRLPSEDRSPEFWTPIIWDQCFAGWLAVSFSSQGRMGLVLSERRKQFKWGEAREREEGKHPIIAKLTQDRLQFSTDTVMLPDGEGEWRPEVLDSGIPSAPGSLLNQTPVSTPRAALRWGSRSAVTNNHKCGLH